MQTNEKFNKKIFIPNAITSLNLICGAFSILISLKYPDKLYLAALFIFVASILDFLDGFVARMLKAQSEFGKQYDSLSDVISFGLAPTFIMFGLIEKATENQYLPFISFTIVVFSAIRLAIFNITNQKDSFMGLPTPAFALFVASIPLAVIYPAKISHIINIYIENVFTNNLFLILATIFFSFLLVSKIQMFSLKFSNLKLKENKIRFIFIFITFVLGVFLWWFAIPVAIILYVFISLITHFKKK